MQLQISSWEVFAPCTWAALGKLLKKEAFSKFQGIAYQSSPFFFPFQMLAEDFVIFGVKAA